MSSDRYEWQVGMALVVEEWPGKEIKPGGVIARLTPTQIVVGSGPTKLRFRRSDGKAIGHASWASVRPSTPDDEPALTARQKGIAASDHSRKCRRDLDTAVHAGTWRWPLSKVEAVLAAIAAHDEAAE